MYNEELSLLKSLYRCAIYKKVALQIAIWKKKW